MIQQLLPGVYQSSLLTGLSVRHYFSGRKFGDQRIASCKNKLFQEIGMDYSRLVRIHQVHGNAIIQVKVPGNRKPLGEYDAMVYEYDRGDIQPPVLGITNADCPPVLFVDPVRNVIAAAHSGWCGTLSGISVDVIGRMTQTGCRPADIFVAVGPAIRGCCYHVDGDRATKFIRAFGKGVDIQYTHGTWSLDLPGIIRSEMIGQGVLTDHIDVIDLCTSCHRSEFFSYRADGKNATGMNMSLITV